ncbi:MAG TPA: hypothetical protein PKC83_11195 [Gemmatimonadaceae bacterium]|nr:hypothetical protein [Gemmatimonadaceae bacterium]
MSTTLEPTVEVQREALTWPERARAMVIDTPESYVAAADMLKGIKALRAKITDTFGPLKAKAHAAWKAICDEQTRADAPLTEAETTIKRAMVAWDTEQARIAAEAARHAAEQARLDEERRRLEEAAALEREAVATGDASLLAEAEAIISEPVVAPVVIVQKATPKVESISYREQWRAEVVDLAALIRAAADNPQLVPLLLPNTTAVNGMARSLKGAMRVPGVRVYSERTVAAGGGR